MARRLSALLLSFLLVSAPMLADDPLPQDQPSPTVRGVSFGASKEALLAALQAQGMCKQEPCSKCAKEKNQPYCYAHGVIGGVYTGDLYSFGEHGLSAVSMMFPIGDYSLMRDTFVAKFGKPTTAETSTFNIASPLPRQ